MADRPRKPRGTTKDLIEAGNLVKSARDKIPEVKLFHCSDDEKWQNDMGNRLMEWVDKDTTNALDNFPLLISFCRRKSSIINIRTSIYKN